MTENTRITYLPNGVRVVTRTVPGNQAADLVILVQTGSQDEYERGYPRGTAHLLEHLPFSSGKILREIGDLGGAIGAQTGFSDTTFWANVPADHALRALEILTKAVCRPTFGQRRIERERSVVLNEWLESELHPEAQMAARVLAAASGGHPALVPSLGTDSEIAAIRRSDLKAFHLQQYHAGRVVVAVEGDIDHDAIVAQLTRQFDLAPGQGIPRPPVPYLGGDGRFPEPGRGTRVTLGFKSPTLRDDAALVASYVVIGAILGGNKNSILYNALRSKRCLVYAVKANPIVFERFGMLVISFISFPEKVAASLVVIRDALRQLTVRVDPSTLERYRRNMDQTYKAPFLKYSSEWLAEALAYSGRVHPRADFLAMCQNTSPEVIERDMFNMLSHPPTFVAMGDVDQLPSQEDVCDLFWSRYW